MMKNKDIKEPIFALQMKDVSLNNEEPWETFEKNKTYDYCDGYTDAMLEDEYFSYRVINQNNGEVVEDLSPDEDDKDYE